MFALYFFSNRRVHRTPFHSCQHWEIKSSRRERIPGVREWRDQGGEGLGVECPPPSHGRESKLLANVTHPWSAFSSLMLSDVFLYLCQFWILCEGDEEIWFPEIPNNGLRILIVLLHSYCAPCKTWQQNDDRKSVISSNFLYVVHYRSPL